MKIATALVLLFAMAASADTGPRLRCRVVVPKEYMITPWDPPPNGQPEPVRYKVAYEAFWWNCVAVRAANIKGRCPFRASGTPAAGAGAYDGVMNADGQINALLKKYSALTVRKYLRTIASQSKVSEKMLPYFQEPTPENPN
jgi:hypothetical protein